MFVRFSDFRAGWGKADGPRWDVRWFELNVSGSLELLLLDLALRAGFSRYLSTPKSGIHFLTGSFWNARVMIRKALEFGE